jgi:hypothetical protein
MPHNPSPSYPFAVLWLGMSIPISPLYYKQGHIHAIPWCTPFLATEIAFAFKNMHAVNRVFFPGPHVRMRNTQNTQKAEAHTNEDHTWRGGYVPPAGGHPICRIMRQTGAASHRRRTNGPAKVANPAMREKNQQKECALRWVFTRTVWLSFRGPSHLTLTPFLNNMQRNGLSSRTRIKFLKTMDTRGFELGTSW